MNNNKTAKSAFLFIIICATAKYIKDDGSFNFIIVVTFETLRICHHLVELKRNGEIFGLWWQLLLPYGTMDWERFTLYVWPWYNLSHKESRNALL